MENGILSKICCKKVIFLIFGCHGNRSRAKNDLQLSLIVSSTYDKDIWVLKKVKAIDPAAGSIAVNGAEAIHSAAGSIAISL